MKKTIIVCLVAFHLSSLAKANEEKKNPVSTSVKAVATEKNKVEEKSSKSDSDDILSGLDYPELQVVPRASERIAMEVQRDWGTFMTLAPIAGSGLATFLTGAAHYHHYKFADYNMSINDKQNSDNAAYFSMLVGASTMVGVYYLNNHEGYVNAANNIKKVKGTDKRSDILRERLAEEALENSARMFHLATYVTTAANFIANMYLSDKASDEVKNYANISALISLAPLIMPNRFVDNYEKHLEYKRKIYTPLVNWSVLPKRSTASHKAEMDSRLNLTWVF